MALAVPLFQQLPKMRGRMVSVFLSILAGSVAGQLLPSPSYFGLAGAMTHAFHCSKVGHNPSRNGDLRRHWRNAPADSNSRHFNGPHRLYKLAQLSSIVFKLTAYMARGLALFGTAAHMIGTTRAFQENEVSGAFSGLALGTNALLTAIVLPVVWQVLTG